MNAAIALQTSARLRLRTRAATRRFAERNARQLVTRGVQWLDFEHGLRLLLTANVIGRVVDNLLRQLPQHNIIRICRRRSAHYRNESAVVGHCDSLVTDFRICGKNATHVEIEVPQPDDLAFPKRGDGKRDEVEWNTDNKELLDLRHPSPQSHKYHFVGKDMESGQTTRQSNGRAGHWRLSRGSLRGYKWQRKVPNKISALLSDEKLSSLLPRHSILSLDSPYQNRSQARLLQAATDTADWFPPTAFERTAARQVPFVFLLAALGHPMSTSSGNHSVDKR